MVRCASHRARNALYRVVGRENAQAFYSFDRYATGGFFRIPAEHLDAARAITGVTRARDGDDLMQCWPSGL